MEKENEWEKSFDKKFVIMSNAGTPLLRYTDAQGIKSFIRSTIHSAVRKERERLAEDIEQLKNGEVSDKQVWSEGYDEGIDEVLSLINKKNNEK